jgi:hypothetical protein
MQSNLHELKTLILYDCSLGQNFHQKAIHVKNNNPSSFSKLTTLNLSHNDLSPSLDILLQQGLFSENVQDLSLVNIDLKSHYQWLSLSQKIMKMASLESLDVSENSNLLVGEFLLNLSKIVDFGELSTLNISMVVNKAKYQ